MLGTGAPGVNGVAGVLTTTVVVVVVAGWPLMVSPVKALPASGLPVAPLVDGEGTVHCNNWCRTHINCNDGIVTVAWVQLLAQLVIDGVGTRRCARWNAHNACEQDAPTGTNGQEGAPKIGAAGVVTVITALPADPTVGVALLSVSLALIALPTLGLPVAPFVVEYVSFTASIAGGTTVTVMVASLQLVGLFGDSHSL